MTGATYQLHIHDAVPSSGAVVIIGLTRTATSLTSFGFTNCIGWNDAAASVFRVTNTSGYAFHNVSIPNNPAFAGLKLYSYWANFDASQPGGLTFTNGVRGVVGTTLP